MLFYIYFLPVTIFWVGVSIYLLYNSRKVQFLKGVTVKSPLEPAVVIIIPIRNEEAELEYALASVCKLKYLNKRIIVINDRSTDRTPEILDRLKTLHPEITILTIDELPSGWLGKNHALYQGYLNSTEEWMLFTDADVKFEPFALTKALQYAITHGTDHLAILPEVKSSSTGFSSIMDTFKLMLEIRQKPWDVSNPQSSSSIGVGAFNLIKRTAYEKAGTHKVIALRPDDDLKLGERVKAANLRQDALYGDGEIWLEWYSSIGEFVRGLMKNTFSVSDYSLIKAIATAFATLIFFALPLPVLLLSGTSTSLIMAVIMVGFQLPLFILKRGMKGIWWYTFMMPLAGFIMVYIIVRSALLTIRQGGIYWRDSFYSLKELKADK